MLSHISLYTKVHNFIALAFFLLSILLPIGSFSQNPKEIYQESIQKTDLGNLETHSRLIIADASNRKRIREIISTSKQFGTTQKMILTFLSPPEVEGSSMLIFDHASRTDEMWIYLPALGKVRRIISTEKGKSFMGSEFSNADMSKPNPDDYHYKLLGNKFMGDIDYYVIELVCKEKSIAKELGFYKKEVWINSKTKLSSKVLYFNKQNKVIKQQTIQNYKQLKSGKFLAHSLKIENLKNKRTSFLEIYKVQSAGHISENKFRPEKLSTH